MSRIQHGVHKNSPLVYNGVGGLVEVDQRKTKQVQEL